jgi:hypothetical protein
MSDPLATVLQRGGHRARNIVSGIAAIQLQAGLPIFERDRIDGDNETKAFEHVTSMERRPDARRRAIAWSAAADARPLLPIVPS